MLLLRRLESSASHTGQYLLIYRGAPSEEDVTFFVFEGVNARRPEESENPYKLLESLCGEAFKFFH